MEVQLHALLISALVAGDSSAPSTGSFTRDKELRYSLRRRFSGPQRRSGRYGEKKHILLLPGTVPDSSVVQTVA
jgi:hypothetical protein